MPKDLPALRPMLSPQGLCFSTQWNVGRTLSTSRQSVIWKKPAADPSKNSFFSFGQPLPNSPLGAKTDPQQRIAGFHLTLLDGGAKQWCLAGPETVTEVICYFYILTELSQSPTHQSSLSWSRRLQSAEQNTWGRCVYLTSFQVAEVLRSSPWGCRTNDNSSSLPLAGR